MDYSLLVGVDDERKELVVGIVGMFVHIHPFFSLPKGFVVDHWA